MGTNPVPTNPVVPTGGMGRLNAQEERATALCMRHAAGRAVTAPVATLPVQSQNMRLPTPL